MLLQLTIRNYAIIDELDVPFGPGLNILTGETGAGKSIIMGALGLILGQRADTSVLRQADRKCVVEGRFSAEGKKAVRQFLESQELDQSEEIFLRREIASNGKSRAFINDSPVTLAQLQQLSENLVDLHQQFDTLALRERDFQRQVLDSMAGQLPLLEEYQQAFQLWQQALQQWQHLEAQRQQREKEADYLRFQWQELEEAGFREQELEEAEAESRLLQHAEDIAGTLLQATQELSESDQPIAGRLRILQQNLQQAARYHEGLLPLVQRLESAWIEIRDVAAELEQQLQRVQANPARLEQLQERLSTGYRLQKKHGLSSTAELLALQSSLEEELRRTDQLGDTLEHYRLQAAEAEKQAHTLATRLTAGRKKMQQPLARKVNELLQRIGMPNARMRVDLEPAELHAGGADQISFLLDANLPPGMPESQGQFQPVGKVASGGELSRLMLCIKSLVARSADLPTLIFDEIDTGISGEAARQVGGIMKDLSAQRQVICITHQPQLAGRADTHYYVYKEKKDDRVITGIRVLDQEARILAIARMLSGEQPTPAALANAREMLLQ